MRRLALWMWSLPVPPWLRRTIEPLAKSGLIQRFVVAHFRCGVVGLIEDADGRLLLLRHTYRREYPWGLPTGFMEHGEQPADALRREIREETGLAVELSAVWRVYTDARSILNVVYRGRARGGTFSPSAEISEANFFARSRLPRIMPEQRGLIEAGWQEDRNEEPA